MKSYPPIEISKPCVLIVDDYADNLVILSRLLSSLNIDIFQATTGEAALALAKKHDLCVAILDVQMPGMNGYDLAELLRGNESTSNLPVIFVTAMYTDEYQPRKSFEAGAVDFLSKPYPPEILISKVRVFIKLYEQQKQLDSWKQWLDLLIEERTLELSQSFNDILAGWARALELGDREPPGHSQRVLRLTMDMAAGLGIDSEMLVNIHRGSLLHDIGKMGISDAILLKLGPLTDPEWQIIRQHPVIAYELLRKINVLEPALNIPYAHHEKWDGSGYPRGLKREEIPLEARIFALADVWDVLTSNRPYRQAMTRQSALQYISENSGSHFDPGLTEYFVKLVERDS